MTQLDPLQPARTYLLGHEEILVAVRKGLKNRRVLPVVRSGLVQLAVTFAVSRSLREHPRSPDLVVLVGGWDNLSVLEAVQVCKARFAACPTMTILIGDQDNVAELLAAGAPDCVRWPVERDGFAVRVRAQLNAAAESPAEIALDPRHFAIRCDNLRATLTPTQFRIFAELVQNSARWITGKELLAAALGETRIDTNRLRFHIFGIRKKLRHEAWRMRSHRTLGYLFDISRRQPP